MVWEFLLGFSSRQLNNAADSELHRKAGFSCDFLSTSCVDQVPTYAILDNRLEQIMFIYRSILLHHVPAIGIMTLKATFERVAFNELSIITFKTYLAFSVYKTNYF